MTDCLPWSDLCPVEHEGCQQQVVAVQDERILAWDNVERGNPQRLEHFVCEGIAEWSWEG